MPYTCLEVGKYMLYINYGIDSGHLVYPFVNSSLMGIAYHLALEPKLDLPLPVFFAAFSTAKLSSNFNISVISYFGMSYILLKEGTASYATDLFLYLLIALFKISCRLTLGSSITTVEVSSKLRTLSMFGLETDGSSTNVAKIWGFGFDSVEKFCEGKEALRRS